MHFQRMKKPLTWFPLIVIYLSLIFAFLNTTPILDLHALVQHPGTKEKKKQTSMFCFPVPFCVDEMKLGFSIFQAIRLRQIPMGCIPQNVCRVAPNWPVLNILSLTKPHHNLLSKYKLSKIQK